MIESAKENVFIREKCERCLAEIIEVMTGSNQKLIGSITPHLKSRNPITRSLATRFLHLTIEGIGIPKIFGVPSMSETVSSY